MVSSTVSRQNIIADRKFLLIKTNKAQQVFSKLDFSMLQVKEYLNVVPIKQQESQSLNKMLQKVDKFNDRALKSEVILRKNSDMLSEAISFTKNTIGKTILCFDVEVLETCHKLILEIGWCTYKTGSKSDQSLNDIDARHYIIKENLKKKNGRYVPDHKHLFSFGTSNVQCLKYVINKFMQDLMVADCVIGHSVDSDFNFLHRFLEFSDLDESMICLDSKGSKKSVVDNHSIQTLKFDNITVKLGKRAITVKQFPIKIKKFDTMFMTSVVLGDAFNHCSLQRALKLFNCTKNDDYIFHNAGNDAYATMKLFLALVHEADVQK